MNNKSNEAMPKINKQYWFEYSKNFIDSAITRREKAATALQKLVLWLWGIYTASTAIGFALSEKQLEFWPTLIIALASGMLILVYWGTVWVQVPKDVKFEVQSAEKIREAHNDIVKSKSKRLYFTLFLSVVAAIMVSIALVVASVSKPSEPLQTAFYAFYGEDAGGPVSITAQVGEVSRVKLSITPVLGGKLENNKSIDTELIPTDRGIIQTSIRLTEEADEVHVQLLWYDKHGIEVQLSKELKKGETLNPK